MTSAQMVRNGTVWTPEPGCSTAEPANVAYRVGRAERYLSGRWLDLGCADGGYATGLLAHGVEELVGVDVDADRVTRATGRNLPNASFRLAHSEALPFDDASFDGTFMNEVFEHVSDERQTLKEVYRVLCPGGLLVLISPNRWFPFEGHGMRTKYFTVGYPVPLLPWLPGILARRWMRARNYWPRQLLHHVRAAGFRVEACEFIWPVMEEYPWLPGSLRRAYQRRIRIFDRLPGLRRFGVSTLVVARRPHRQLCNSNGMVNGSTTSERSSR